jgi:hypothetical protein
VFWVCNSNPNMYSMLFLVNKQDLKRLRKKWYYI